MTRVMVVGASGVFGSRLVEQLAASLPVDLILAGRHLEKAAVLMGRFEVFDRSRPDVARLKELAPLVLIDAAGPFQNSSLVLPEACIAAGITYIDLADARDFVARIPALDAAAKQAGVAVISGASSTPALSHAVIDHFTAGWEHFDTILVAIAPGNRAPRGLSVVQAILSYVGRPLRLFREGRWGEAPGWSCDEAVNFAGVGRRRVALCETPDLDLLVERYHPRVRAEFKAGLELGVLHHGLRLLSALRAHRLLPPLESLARPLRAVAAALDGFGSDTGGMLVRVTGLDGENRARCITWSLAARSGIGPNVPVLPAVALVQQLAAAGLEPGARAAAGELRYEEVLNHLNRLGIETQVTLEDLGPPFQFEKALGGAWATLPEITRRIHTTAASVVLEGAADIEGAETAAGRWLAKAFGFPEAGSNVPVRVVIENDGPGERWARQYPTRTMYSYMTNADQKRGTIEEHMGPFAFRLKLVGTAAGIDLVPDGWRYRWLALPNCLLPDIVASERASADGRHLFDVRVALRPFGRLVHYRGWLRPAVPS